MDQHVWQLRRRVALHSDNYSICILPNETCFAFCRAPQSSPPEGGQRTRRHTQAANRCREASLRCPAHHVNVVEAQVGASHGSSPCTDERAAWRKQGTNADLEGHLLLRVHSEQASCTITAADKKGIGGWGRQGQRAVPAAARACLPTTGAPTPRCRALLRLCMAEVTLESFTLGLAFSMQEVDVHLRRKLATGQLPLLYLAFDLAPDPESLQRLGSGSWP